MTIQAIFFDYGGVVARMDLAEMHRLEKRHGLPVNGLWDALFSTAEWDNVKLGKGSEKAWLNKAESRLEEMASGPITGLKNEWMAAWRGLDQDVIDLIAKLRSRYPVGMISNATRSLNDELDNHHKIGHLFDPVVNSARVGIAKPDSGIYRLAADLIGKDPSDCLHIDDLQPNVDGAQAAGFKAIRYTGDCAALERNLRQLGLDW